MFSLYLTMRCLSLRTTVIACPQDPLLQPPPARRLRSCWTCRMNVHMSLNQNMFSCHTWDLSFYQVQSPLSFSILWHELLHTSTYATLIFVSWGFESWQVSAIQRPKPPWWALFGACVARWSDVIQKRTFQLSKSLQGCHLRSPVRSSRDMFTRLRMHCIGLFFLFFLPALDLFEDPPDVGIATFPFSTNATRQRLHRAPKIPSYLR